LLNSQLKSGPKQKTQHQRGLNERNGEQKQSECVSSFSVIYFNVDFFLSIYLHCILPSSIRAFPHPIFPLLVMKRRPAGLMRLLFLGTRYKTTGEYGGKTEKKIKQDRREMEKKNQRKFINLQSDAEIT